MSSCELKSSFKILKEKKNEREEEEKTSSGKEKMFLLKEEDNENGAGVRGIGCVIIVILIKEISTFILLWKELIREVSTKSQKMVVK